MNNGLLLWVDDEVELLKAHIIFLEKKGYQVVTVSNGADAIEQCRQQTFDLILLDEMMPGLSGLETLQQIKDIQPATPVVMCTKSEEEDIMNQAIGSKIADYLIKPVNPNQILLSLKKNIHQREIVSEVTQSSYQQEYQQLAMQIMDSRTWKDWMDIYRRLVKWELELSSTNSPMTEMLQMQKEEANLGFAKYVSKNYLDWMQQLASLNQNEERPCMSPDVFKTKIFPHLNQGEKVFLIVIDNFRYDQWKVLAHDIGDLFDIEEDMYMSILPTATQYARNAIFSGLMPDKIAQMFPDLWVDEEEEEGGKSKIRFAPLAVFCTFFVAELGDKTQLTAITFGANEGMGSAFVVWIGCSLGLFAADILGMLVGYLLKSKTPDGLLNTLAFVIFSIFGAFTLHQGLNMMNARVCPIPVWPVWIAAAVIFTALCVWIYIKRKKENKCDI